jgi:hypothetical protein
MGIYTSLSDEDLANEIAEYRAAVKKASLGGVGKVAGEGRMIEYVQGNIGDARLALRELYAEAARRGLDTGPSGSAIAVEIG